MKKKYKLILVIIWMIFIFIMSVFDSNESANQSNLFVNFISKLFDITNIQMLSFIVRKLAHFTEYLILGILVSNWLSNYNSRLYLNIIICAIYAISDEVHQLFVPGRSCEVRDMLIDIFGAIAGILLFTILSKKNKN